MPLQKTYLSIEHKSTFGVIASNASNIVYDASGKFAFCAALHDIHIWSLSEKKKITTLAQPANDSSNDVGVAPSIITSLLLSPTKHHIIAGHEDGTIKVWDYKSNTLLITFNGHNSRITCLSFNHDATKMASGSYDTDIIVWDMIAQRGLFRLRGHIKPITKVQFIQIDDLLLRNDHKQSEKRNVQYTPRDEDNEMLLSSSRDTSLKLWELETQHCVQTIVGHKNEVWSFDISKDKQFIVSGGLESEVYVWKIEPHVIDEDVSDSDQSDDDNDVDMKEHKIVVSCISSIRVRGLGTVECGAMMGKKTRIVHMAYNEQSNLLFAQTNSNTIQLFYCRTNKEIKKRLQFRTQKEKKKAQTKTKEDININININIKLEGSDYLIGLTPIRTQYKLSSIDIAKTLIAMRSLKTKQYAKQLVQKKNKPKINMDIDNDNDDDDEMIISNEDEHKLQKLKETLRKHEVSSHDVLLQPILLSYMNNMIATMYVPVAAVNADINFIKIDEWKKKYLANYVSLNSIGWDGHRTAVRSLQFSSDDSMIVSTCKNELKIWNTRSMRCIRNLECEYGLKCIFAPGNKHVIVATKQGNILIYDLVINEMIQKCIAHDGEVYCMCLTSDGTGIVTGGADSCIKIWKFNLKMIANVKQLCISLRRSVVVQDEVLAVACSANGEYLAASLLDNTIQIFLFDSMKFYITLFGHKLPAFGLDISSDSTILVSGSADKNIKIWGIQHGDCKKSLFAHSDSVMQIKFVRDTHYFYSCSKDGLIKYWDADKFKKIQELSGHSGEVWCMDVNSSSQLLVSSGGDRSFRMWLESNEALFPLQEEQKELEKLFDSDLEKDNKHQQPTAIEGSGLIKDGVIESHGATKRTMSAIERGESLMEAIHLCDNDIEKRKFCKDNEKEYVMNARLRVAGMRSVEQYMFHRLEAIPTCDIEEVMMILPFEYLSSLFYYLQYCIQRSKQIEKMIRCVLFLVKYHYQQLLSSHDLKIQLKTLKEISKKELANYRNKIGYNVQAMKYMQQRIKDQAKYVQEAERYKKTEIEQENMYKTWAENSDDEDIQDID